MPLCTVAWNSTDSLSYTVAITGQLTQTAVLNLTRHDNGKIIECRAQCQDFPDLHLTEEVIINVPCKFYPINFQQQRSDHLHKRINIHLEPTYDIAV